MNRNLIIGLAIIVLVVLGYFALQPEDESPMQPMDGHGMNMEAPSESALDLVKDNVDINFNEDYAINDEWSIKVIQFEPNAKINGPGLIVSDSDEEINPAVKIEFYKNGELIHYQICFREMPGFHSIKQGQEYIIDLINYDGFSVQDGQYSIKSINAKIWRIK